VRRFLDFWRDQRGNTAMIFGLAVIPLLALGGGAVDFAQRARIKGEIQSAADTASLAAARIVQTGQLSRDGDWEENWEEVKRDAERTARRLLASAIRNLGTEGTPDFNIEITEDSVSIQASYNMKTSFLPVIGMTTLPANTLAEVNLPDPILVEIALVLDYSGSMNDNNKYVRMTAAAQQFIDKVSKDRGDRTKVGIVPFSEFVLATLPAGMIRGTPAADANTPMTTCMLNRDYPYSTEDSTPTTSIQESRWPSVDVADPRCQAYVNGNLAVRDLTNDFDAVKDALSDMRPTGLTNIALASEMGFHLLAPNRPFETARDFSDTENKKIMILLTDGVQTVSAMGPGGAVSTLAADETTAEVCTNAKAEDIRIFTIAYDIEEERVRTLLSGCASSATAYFEPNGVAGIDEVFDEIFSMISESAWLSK
jgi:Flp pilus assembly protein TadG